MWPKRCCKLYQNDFVGRNEIEIGLRRNLYSVVPES